MSAPSATSHVVALDSSQVKTVGLGAIIVIVLIGLIISFVVTRIITKIITIAIMVALVFVLYNQRQKVIDAIDNSAKKCDATFFGVHVQPSDENIKKACAAVAKQRGS